MKLPISILKIKWITFCRWFGELPPDERVPQPDITAYHLIQKILRFIKTMLIPRCLPSVLLLLAQKMASMQERHETDLGLKSQLLERGAIEQNHNLMSRS